MLVTSVHGNGMTNPKTSVLLDGDQPLSYTHNRRHDTANQRAKPDHADTVSLVRGLGVRHGNRAGGSLPPRRLTDFSPFMLNLCGAQPGSCGCDHQRFADSQNHRDGACAKRKPHYISSRHNQLRSSSASGLIRLTS